MTVKAISIELSVNQQALLQRQLESGHYESLTEIFDDALRLMDEHNAVFSEWLRVEVRASLAGRPSSRDEVFMAAGVKVRHPAKAARRDA